MLLLLLFLVSSVDIETLNGAEEVEVEVEVVVFTLAVVSRNPAILEGEVGSEESRVSSWRDR